MGRSRMLVSFITASRKRKIELAGSRPKLLYINGVVEILPYFCIMGKLAGIAFAVKVQSKPTA